MQAAGEAVLRSALQELQVWGLERKFALITYTPVAGDSRYNVGTLILELVIHGSSE